MVANKVGSRLSEDPKQRMICGVAAGVFAPSMLPGTSPKHLDWYSATAAHLLTFAVATIIPTSFVVLIEGRSKCFYKVVKRTPM